jgi:diaminohydroxyphosphoribosylaminopyrimidine deaminase/5-amino-6-(5-phosphoribosylamino)uracil reductase
VDVGVGAAEAEWLNAPFLQQRRTGRSYLTLKLALTLDGRLAAADGSSRWVTGDDTRRRVHQRRSEADALLVGSGTVIADDPSLSVRDVDTARQPIVFVADARGRIPSTAKLFERENVVMVTTVSAPHEQQLAWKEAGAEILVLPLGPGGIDLDALIAEVGRRGMMEVYCEGGAALATSLLAQGLVDRLEVHLGPKMVGYGGPAIGELGVTTMGEAIAFELKESHVSDGDLIAIYAGSR